MQTIQSRRNRESGTRVTITSREPLAEGQAPFYVCQCEDHADGGYSETSLAHHSLREARLAAPHPFRWCDGCADDARQEILMAFWDEFDMLSSDPSGDLFGNVPLGDLSLWDLQRSLRAARAVRDRRRAALA